MSSVGWFFNAVSSCHWVDIVGWEGLVENLNQSSSNAQPEVLLGDRRPLKWTDRQAPI